MPEIDELSRTLGVLQAGLDTIMRVQAEDRIASAQYRTDVRRDQGETRDSVGAVKNDVAVIKHKLEVLEPKVTSLDDIRVNVQANTIKLAELEPTVLSLNQRATMSAGAAKLALGIGRFVHLLSAILGGAIALLIDRWIGK